MLACTVSCSGYCGYRMSWPCSHRAWCVMHPPPMGPTQSKGLTGALSPSTARSCSWQSERHGIRSALSSGPNDRSYQVSNTSAPREQQVCSWLTDKVRSMADVCCQGGCLHNNVSHGDGFFWTCCCWHHLPIGRRGQRGHVHGLQKFQRRAWAPLA